MITLFWMMYATVAAAWNAQLSPQEWQVVNDTVMGGVSQAQVIQSEQGGVRFTGTLSLENNGGFTSTRTQVTDPDWTEQEAVRLRVKGDGRTYICTVRIRDRRMRRFYYRAVFSSTKSEVSEVVIPLSDFEPYVFGRRAIQVPPLTSMLDNIGSMGIMLADKNPGPFSLEILEAVTVPSPKTANPRRDDSSIPAIFRSAIDTGVPLFNAGQVQACAETYSSAIASVLMLPSDQLSEASRARLETALRQAKSEQDSVSKAWIYRHAMDWVIAQKPD